MHIFIIDNMSDVRLAMTEILEIQGHSVSSFHSGIDALSWLRHKHVDGVFYEMTLPIVNGMAFHHAVSEQWPEMAEKIVFMATDYTKAQELFLKQTGSQWLTKPFTISDMLNRIN